MQLNRQGQRHDHLHAHEHSGQHPAKGDRRGHPGGEAGRPGGQQPAQAEHHRRQPDDRAGNGRQALALPEPGHAGDSDRSQQRVADPPPAGRATVAVRAAQLPQRRQDQYAADGHERGQAGEHPAPGQLLGDPAGQYRADQSGHDPGAGKRGEHPGPDLVLVDLAHYDVDGGHQQPDRQALHEPGRHQHPHRLGGAADQQTGHEQHQAAQQWPAGAVGIGVNPGDDHAHHAGDQEPGERPAVGGQAVQAAGRGRQRGGDCQRLEGDDGHQDEDAERGDAVARREDRLVRAVRLARGWLVLARGWLVLARGWLVEL